MATNEYVSVTGDDWYQRRRNDAEGKFFRTISDQAGRGSHDSSGGSTRQGIYCLTAGGKLLAFKNAGQAPDVMRDVLRQGLAKWQKLPETERRPGAVQVADAGTPDPRYSRTPPPGGLIIDVCTRSLDRNAQGELCDAQCKVGGGDEAGRDHLWLTAAECKTLVPDGAKRGDKYPVPSRIGERIVRFHLLDNTRGEPPMWQRNEIRASDLALTVEEATPAGIRLRLDGSALLATNSDISKADRGYDVRLLGYVHYDAAKKTLDRFDVVAVGEHWGEGTYTRGARPGRTPLGVAFALSAGKSDADRVPPQAAREMHEYMGQGN